MGDQLYSYDRALEQPFDQQFDQSRPDTALLVQARDVSGETRFNETVRVDRPAGVTRQRDQLVRAVRDVFPDARLHRVTSEGALFIAGDWIVTSRYGASI